MPVSIKEKDPKQEFVFFTANCSLKYNNSIFPCECQPWFDYWWGSSFTEPNCQKCKFAIDVGAVQDPEEEKEEQHTIDNPKDLNITNQP